MLARKILVSTLLASLIGFTGVANAKIKLIKTTDGSEIALTDPKSFGDTIKKDNVKTAAEIEFLKTGKNIYVGDAKAIKRGKKKDLGCGHVLSAMDLLPAARLDQAC